MADKTTPQFEENANLDLDDLALSWDSQSGKQRRNTWRQIIALFKGVAKVNGKLPSPVGEVVLSADDINDTASANKFVAAAEKQRLSLIKTDGLGNKYLNDQGQYQSVAGGSNYQAGPGINAADLADQTLALDLSFYQAPAEIVMRAQSGAHLETSGGGMYIRSFDGVDTFRGDLYLEPDGSVLLHSGPSLYLDSLGEINLTALQLKLSVGSTGNDTGTLGQVLTTDGEFATWEDVTVAWGKILGNLADQTDLASALAAKENAGVSVLLTGNQTITGTKTFSGSLIATLNLVVGYTVAGARLHVRGDSASVGLAALIENSAGTSLLAVNNAGGAALTGNLSVSALAGSSVRAVDVDATGKLIASRAIIFFGKLVQYSPVEASGLAETSLLTGLINGTRTFNSSSHPSNPELHAGASYSFLGGGTLTTAASLGSLQLRFKLGAATIADTGSVNLGGLLVASTAYHFRVDLDLDVRALGPAGSVFVTGRLVLTHPTSGTTVAVPFGPTAATALDTTADRLLDFTAQQTVTASTFSLQTFKVVPLI